MGWCVLLWGQRLCQQLDGAQEAQEQTPPGWAGPPVGPAALAVLLAGTGWCPENAKADLLGWRWRPDTHALEPSRQCDADILFSKFHLSFGSGRMQGREGTPRTGGQQLPRPWKVCSGWLLGRPRPSGTGGPINLFVGTESQAVIFCGSRIYRPRERASHCCPSAALGQAGLLMHRGVALAHASQQDAFIPHKSQAHMGTNAFMCYSRAPKRNLFLSDLTWGFHHGINTFLPWWVSSSCTPA